MDVVILAGQAIEVAADQMAGAAAGAASGPDDEAVAGLRRVVTQRLRQTGLGAAVLTGLEEQPRDPGRRGMAASALAESAASDEAFRAELYWAVHAVFGARGPAGQAATGQQANVSAGGNLAMSRSDIAAGNIDKSRRTRISTGGWIVAGLLAIGAGTTGVVVAASGPTDPAKIGTERNEDGVRAAVTAYMEAFSAKDGPRTCAFVRQSKRDVSYVDGCAEYLASHVFATISADRLELVKKISIGKVEISPNSDSAEVYFMVGSESGGDPLWVEYESGRWFVDVNIDRLGSS
ncbi:hypothetical protein OG943_07480 [Amycolatopsis sp. NBC_00345]|uniref:hypothetical protein n=1 Tax=Amycolatopsis sp. NBC_00345 TaxID=2975955 RepID=UPI002E256038